MRKLRPRGFLQAAAVLGAALLAGCTSAGDNPTIQGSPTASVTSTVSAASPNAASPPFTTIQSAEAYVQTQAGDAGGPFEFIGVDSTWRPAGTLHVIHATPTTSASYGGDYYFFFVNGTPVDRFSFTASVSEHAPDATSLTVTYHVFKPGDPHCCPTGGTAITTFQWDGSKLTHDPAPGATQN